MYIVTKPFYDLQDVTKADHTKDGDIPREFWLYKAGDVYPRDGAIPPTEQRIRELASDENKQGTPLIAWVDIAWVEPEPELPQSDAESEPEPEPEPAQPAETDEKPAKAEEPDEPKKPARKPPVKAPAKKRTPRTSAKPARKKGT